MTELDSRNLIVRGSNGGATPRRLGSSQEIPISGEPRCRRVRRASWRGNQGPSSGPTGSVPPAHPAPRAHSSACCLVSKPTRNGSGGPVSSTPSGEKNVTPSGRTCFPCSLMTAVLPWRTTSYFTRRLPTEIDSSRQKYMRFRVLVALRLEDGAGRSTRRRANRELFHFWERPSCTATSGRPDPGRPQGPSPSRNCLWWSAVSPLSLAA
jgi:hypothetical protein